MGESAFTKAVIKYAGLSYVSIIISVCAGIFGVLGYYYEGVTITTKQVYWYDEYERLGKWYLVDAYFEAWK